MPAVAEFSQLDINQGYLSYEQLGEIPEEVLLPSDQFRVDVIVRNVGAQLNNFTVEMKIIPKLIPLR